MEVVMMERQLYFIKIPGRKGIYDIIVAAFSEVNAKAIAEEYFEIVNPEKLKNAIDNTYIDKNIFILELSQICLNAKIAFSNLISPPFPSSMQTLSFKISYQLSHRIK